LPGLSSCTAMGGLCVFGKKNSTIATNAHDKPAN
jgi:hypothetical protein